MSDDTLDVFTRSPVLRAVQAAIFAQCAELVDAVLGVINGRMLESAQGAQLETIGRIVGLYPRPTIDAGGIVYFSPDAALRGADVAPAFVTGAPTSGTVPVDDVRYRVFIKAQILKNHTRHGSAPELLNYGVQAFGLPISVRSEGSGDVSVTVPSTTTAEQVANITKVVDNNQCDRLYTLPLPTTARIQRIKFRFPVTFTPDRVGSGADVAPVGVGYVLNT